jgi:hypothetical protein
MSADRISLCPACGDYRLRQWYEFEYQTAKHMPHPDLMNFVVRYTAVCDCGFEHNYSPTSSVKVVKR